jgi:hypothetical protein
MNEQIKELMGQTLDEKFAGTWSVMDLQDLTKFTDRFAELIVEECMWKIMTRKEEAIDNDWRVDEAMSAAISDISEHFGVEE